MAARRGPIDADADAADAIVAVIAERFVPDAGERLNVEALRQRKVVDVASEGHGDVLRHFLFHRPRAAGTNRVVHRGPKGDATLFADAMPTVLRLGSYRFFFFAGDAGEPPHVHVQRDDADCKFWLTPCRLATSSGFQAAELRVVGRLVEDHSAEFLERWHEFFNGDEHGSDSAG